MKNEIYTLHLFPYPLQISMASSRHIALFVEVLEVLSEASRQFKLFRSWDQTTAGDHGLNRFFFKKTPETDKNPALFCGFWTPLWLRTCSIYENWDATSPGEPMGQVKHRILPETDVLPVSGPADILIYLKPTECLVGGLEHESYDFPLSWE